nr:MAG TPA_asm: hypothetical protein [Caudoviricetes sp.]
MVAIVIVFRHDCSVCRFTFSAVILSHFEYLSWSALLVRVRRAFQMTLKVIFSVVSMAIC